MLFCTQRTPLQKGDEEIWVAEHICMLIYVLDIIEGSENNAKKLASSSIGFNYCAEFSVVLSIIFSLLLH